MVSTNRTLERGVVSDYLKHRGFGFIALEQGGQLFFFITKLLDVGLDSIEPGTAVTFIRGVDRDGREQVGRFLEIDGQVVVHRDYQLTFERVDGQFVRRKNVGRNEMITNRPAVQETHASSVAERVPERAEPENGAAVAIVSKPNIDESMWVNVGLGKIRPDRTTYGKTDLGPVLIPWTIFIQAGIRSLKRGEGLQGRFRKESEGIVAIAVRRQ